MCLLQPADGEHKVTYADVIKEAGLLYLSEHAARGIVNVGAGYLRSKN